MREVASPTVMLSISTLIEMSPFGMQQIEKRITHWQAITRNQPPAGRFTFLPSRAYAYRLLRRSYSFHAHPELFAHIADKSLQHFRMNVIRKDFPYRKRGAKRLQVASALDSTRNDSSAAAI